MIKCFNFDYDYTELSSNTYIIGEKYGPCVIIDLGSTQRKISDYIKENHSEVKAILLTHNHFDHIRGIDKFLEKFSNVPIYIDEYDYEGLKNSKLNCSLIEGHPFIVKANNVFKVKNQQILDFGKNLLFKVYETPFHTDGSVCYLNEDINALFSGDTLFKGSIGRADLPTSNRNLIRSSLDIVKKFNENLVVYPGHGETTTIKEELLNNYYLK